MNFSGGIVDQSSLDEHFAQLQEHRVARLLVQDEFGYLGRWISGVGFAGSGCDVSVVDSCVGVGSAVFIVMRCSANAAYSGLTSMPR